MTLKRLSISVDRATLARVDRLAARSENPTRSALVGTALQEFLDREQRLALEHSDGAIYHRHRAKLRRQAEALVKEQSKR